MKILILYKHKTFCYFMLELLNSLNIESFFTLNYLENIIDNKYDEIINEHNSKINIPIEDIKILNSSNVFTCVNINIILDILNKHFDYIFLPFYDHPNFNNILDNFKGSKYIFFFGHAFPTIYDNIIQNYINNISSNIYFIYTYHNILNYQIINPSYKKISKFFPIGLSNNFIDKYKNTYNPVFNKIVFVCSKLDSISYYKNIYNLFIKNFNMYDHIILGHNKKNNNIIGDINDHDYYEYIKSSKLMYYHSIEKCHLHYHPIEAMIIGLPVLCMKTGLIEILGLTGDGLCDDINDVKNKIDRIFNNDIILINSILKSQQIFLENNYYNVNYQKYLTNIFQ